jgi:peptide-methionine (R)-S-oxide reductase
MITTLIILALVVHTCDAFSSSLDRKLPPLSLRATEDDSIVEERKGMRTWNPFALAVLKLKFTEPAWTSSLNYQKSAGTYLCANCGTPLFSSSGKFDSGTGWPSFWKTFESNRVSLEREWDGRMECQCANCGGHLGHVFTDGPTRGSLDAKELDTVPETDPKIDYKGKNGNGNDDVSKYTRMPRFCINGIAMQFEEEKR